MSNPAEEQHGIVTRAQALAMGYTARVINGNVARGLWQRLHQRVYATFSGPPPRIALIWAAVLAAGDGAAASHATAAELIGLVDAGLDPIHVTLPPNRRVRPIRGVVIHLSGRVDIACHPNRRPRQTRVEETVLDLADASSTADRAVVWCSTAVGKRLTTASRLGRALSDRARHRWRTELAAALEDVEAECRSPLEIRYLHRVERAHGLPAGARQVRHDRLGGNIYDDVRYAAGVVVELDGRVAHPPERLLRDLSRDNVAGERGDVVLHYGWSDVSERSCEVASRVAQVLRHRGWMSAARPCRRSDCKILKSPPPHR